MDEHLSAWSIAWAELRQDELARLTPRTEPLGTIPDYPCVEIDFSFLVEQARPYSEIAQVLASFSHGLLKQIRFISAYQGDPVPAGRRSVTVRAVVGDDNRTLVDADINTFRRAFDRYVTQSGYEIRSQ